MITINSKDSIKLSDLKTLIKQCEENKIPDDTYVHLFQYGNNISTAKQILADEVSINIYDFN